MVGSVMSLLIWFGMYRVDFEDPNWPSGGLFVCTLLSAIGTACLINSYLNEYVHLDKI